MVLSILYIYVILSLLTIPVVTVIYSSSFKGKKIKAQSSLNNLPKDTGLVAWAAFPLQSLPGYPP